MALTRRMRERGRALAEILAVLPEEKQEVFLAYGQGMADMAVHIAKTDVLAGMMNAQPMEAANR